MIRTSIPVLILNYNGWDDTLILTELLLGRSQNVWVIDNGSPIDRSEELLKRFPTVNYLPLANNWGWSGGYNRAIDHVRQFGFEHVYILNNDALPEAGAIESAVRHLSSLPNAAVIGSVMLTDKGRQVCYDGDFYDTPKSASDVQPGLAKTDRIHGGGFALSLAAFERVGPFHEPYFLYHEEIDWCLRAGALGLDIYVDGSSRILHEGQASDTNSNALYYLSRNRYLALRRGLPLHDHARSVNALVCGDLAEAAQRTAHQREATLDGMLDGIAGRFGQRSPARRSALRRNAAVGMLWLRVFPFRFSRRLKRFFIRD